MVKRVKNADGLVQHVEARNEVKHAFSSHAKALRFFGHVPRYSLEAGLTRMAAWVRQVGSRATPAFGNIEIYRNLPPVWLEKADGSHTPAASVQES